MKYSWVLAIISLALCMYLLYNTGAMKNEAYQQGYVNGAHNMLYSVQSKEVFLDDYSIEEFKDWKQSCEDKWKVDCGLGYFKIDGVGVYQVSPKKSD